MGLRRNTISRSSTFITAGAAFVIFLATAALAAASPIQCPNPEGCEAAISKITQDGVAAYRLSNGQTEAVVVPAYGRVMRFGTVGGGNWLWNNERKSFAAGEWKNWGGDKIWPAPQSEWPRWNGTNWPPDPAWDGQPFKAEVLTGGTLRLTGSLSLKNATQLVRDFSYDEKNGDFVIRQTVRKLPGDKVRLSLWSVTQIEAPERVFLPLGKDSTYPEGFQWIRVGGAKAPAPKTAAAVVAPGLLAVTPTTEAPLKIGVDGPLAAIAAVKNGWAFLQRAPSEKGDYPDGVEGGRGFPVELFDNGQTKTHYLELELLSPLRDLKEKGGMSHTVRWSLHSLPGNDPSDPAVIKAVGELLERQ